MESAIYQNPYLGTILSLFYYVARKATLAEEDRGLYIAAQCQKQLVSELLSICKTVLCFLVDLTR